MKANIFDSFVKSWSDQLTWSKGDLAKATKTLLAISIANGGELAPDVQISPELATAHAIQRATDALQRRPIDNSSIAKILSSLKATHADVLANPFGVAKHLHYTRASNALIENARREKVHKLTESRVTNIKGASLIFDGEYLSYVNALLAKAKQSIYVMMFFMKYEEGKKYPVNSLVENLAKAKQREADVKIILDKDPDAGVVGSRLINEPVFQFLKKNGVPVVYDKIDQMTHSKLLIIDGRHAILGSHNWTAGSLMAYDDTSVHVESEELALKFQKSFIDFWNKYS